MINIYGRKLPDPDRIARNLVQLAEEDRRRVHHLALRGSYEPMTCMFSLGRSHRRWWISPVCTSTLLMIAFLAKDWSWNVLDQMLTSMGFK